ncbi:MAG: DUF5667 domain-containing protein [Patescibacteria group bacterium]
MDMDDKELHEKISLLKTIRPREEWVVLTKNRLFRRERAVPSFGWGKTRFSRILDLVSWLRYYLQKPSFVLSCFALLISGIIAWHIVIKSLPGDALYPVRTAAERILFTFSPEEEKPFLQLAIVQRRLEDLKRIAGDREGGDIKNLSSAIQEFKENVSGVSKSIGQIVEKKPEKTLRVVKELVQFQREKAEIEKVLGTTIGEEAEDELEDVMRSLLEREFGELGIRSLTEKQEILFQEAKALYERGDYQGALEKVWALENLE